jgi:hypothetical protein
MLADPTTPGPTTAAIAEVHTQTARVDTKASILFGLSLAALTGGGAILTKVHPSGPAAAAAALTVALIGAALVLLGAAIRPALGGNHGFVRWAAAPTPAHLKEVLDADATTDVDRVTQLWALSRAVDRKYRRVRLAVDLLGVALAVAALTAVLTLAV